MKFKKDRTMNRVILGGAFIIIALLGAFGLFSGDKNDDNPVSSILPVGSGNIALEASLSTAGLRSLEFACVSADITVIPTNSNSVTVTLTGESRVTPELLVDKSGSRGFFQVKWPKTVFNNATDMKMEIFLPSDYQYDIRFESVSGEITLPENWEFDSVSAKTVSGNIESRDISCSNYDASSVSGDITLSDISSSEVSLSTVSGDIDYTGSLVTLAASSVSGNVEIFLDSLTGRIKCSSTSGNIDLNLPESISADIDFSTVSGSLISDIPILTTEAKKNHLSGIIGDGTYPIEGHTVSGNIHIVKN